MPDPASKATTFDAWTSDSDDARTKSTTVVFLTNDPVDEEWLKRVAAEKGTTTLFLVPEGDSFRVLSDDKPVARNDLKVAAAAVGRQFRQFRNREISFITDSGPRKVKPSSESLAATTIFSQAALEEQIKRDNLGPLNRLVQQLRSPLGVIPLVGAGLPAAICFTNPPKRFPQWGELLLGLAQGKTIEPEIRRLVNRGDYEGAAQKIDKDSPGALPQKIKDAFDRKVGREQLLTGALSYLPYLARGPVITTNFDNVLEQAFAAANEPLTPVYGPLAYRIVNAIHQNERVLLKIHGDCADPTFRVLTVSEYEKAYGVKNEQGNRHKAPSIGSMAWVMFTNRPLLCLGCSLEQDRTTDVLRALRAQVAGLTHYAILASHYSLRRLDQRKNELLAMGVTPVWFAPGEFKQIESLLHELLERSSTEPLAPPPAPPASKPKPVDAAAAIERLREVGPLIEPKNESVIPEPLVRSITHALTRGKLAFFLGAYAHLEHLPLGNDFYIDLGNKFGCPALEGDRTAVAAFIASRKGTEELWAQVSKVLSPVKKGPSAVYKFLATLPAVLRHKKLGPLWIFTTNYDTMLEEVMTAAGERFHLLYYVGGTATEHEGLFIEQSVDGALRVIEQPGNIRGLNTDAPVIVKLNGGLVYNDAFTESVLITTGHFERLAAGIPKALPLYVRNALREKSLLFLGHGLREPDVQKLIEFSAPADHKMKSWAIQHPADPEQVKFWSGRGLEIVDADLSDFLKAIHTEWSKVL